MYDVVHRCVSMVASLASSTAKAMCCQGIDFRPRVTAGVGTKQGGTQSQSNCHRDSLVLHMQAKGRNWQGFQPGSRFIAEEASRRARALGSGADSRSLSAADVTVTRSQDFWCDRASPSGGGWLCPFDQCASASSQLGRGTSRRRVGHNAVHKVRGGSG